jgi:hypothetical protein
MDRTELVSDHIEGSLILRNREGFNGFVHITSLEVTEHSCQLAGSESTTNTKYPSTWPKEEPPKTLDRSPLNCI